MYSFQSQNNKSVAQKCAASATQSLENKFSEVGGREEVRDSYESTNNYQYKEAIYFSHTLTTFQYRAKRAPITISTKKPSTSVTHCPPDAAHVWKVIS